MDQLEDRDVPATLTVTTDSDAVSHTGVSLRDAIAQAESTGEDDTIVFDASLAGATITLAQGQLTLSNASSGAIAIDGSVVPITVDALGNSIVFDVGFGVRAMLDGCTLLGGSALGAIQTSGTIRVSHSTISGSAGVGIAVVNGLGRLMIRSSLIAGNTQAGVVGFGEITVTNCTITGNNGGGIRNGGYSSAKIVVSNSTIVGNSIPGGDGGGLWGHFTLVNTIVANNTAGAYPDAAAQITGTNNLIGIDHGVAGIANGVGGNRIGTTANPLTPLLGSLQNNGGKTASMALLDGSPAINSGGAVTILTQNAGKTSSTISVGDARTIAAGQSIFVAGEVLLVTSSNVNNTLTVVRGVHGVRADLRANSSVFLLDDQRGDRRASPPDIGAYQYTVPSAPALLSMSPASGPTVGGDLITIVGTNLGTLGTTAMTFGNKPAIVLNNDGSTLVVAVPTVPADSEGPVDVKLGTTGGVATSPQQFTYLAASTNVATITVTVGTDAVGDAGTSLRDALAIANDIVTSNVNATIQFAPSLAANTITLSQGQLDLSAVGDGTLTIDGTGLSSPITVSGNNGSRVFQVDTGVEAAVNGLVIQGGNVAVTDYGAGIHNLGTLTVSNTAFSGNSAGYGGGIFNDGTMTLSNATLSGNSAAFGGGGIYSSGALTVRHSTVSGNSAGAGGGILNAGALTVIGSTFSFNAASMSAWSHPGNGGGIAGNGVVVNSTFYRNSATATSSIGGNGGAIAGAASVINCTIYGNFASNLTVPNARFAGSGGGLYMPGLVVNTIVAANTATGGGPAVEKPPTVLQQQVNGALALGSGHNRIAGNPRLAVLGDYGGPTQTIALQSSSSAINGGGSIATLAAGVNDTTTTIAVSGAGILGSLIKIDSEWMLVTSVSGNNLTVVRGHGGTTAASHAGNTGVFLVTDQRGGIRGTPDIGAFEYGAQVVDRFSVRAPKNTPTGTPVPIVVRAITTMGATATGFRGTIHFTSSDAWAGLPADYTFTAADRGQRTFMVTFTTVGTTSLTATDTAQSWVTGQDSLWVNTAPVLAIGSPNLPAVRVNDANPAGIPVNGLAGEFMSDVDAGAVEGIAVIRTRGASSGQWQFSTNGGTDWTTFGIVSSRVARLLDANHKVRFLPNPNYTLMSANSVLPSITYRAWDQTTGNAGQTASIPVVGRTTAFSVKVQTGGVRVNDAPTLTPAAPNLATIAPNKTFVTTIAALLGSSVQDPGAGTRQGIAITGLTTPGGKWQFSTNGGMTYRDFGTVGESSALMLRAIDRLRFVPLGFTGTATVTFRAWDQTSGAAGKVADLSAVGAVGERSAFSSATDTGSLQIV